MQTEKIYYKNQFQSSCKAKLIGKTKEGLIFDKTVAYPEGGAQIGDKGKLIRTKNNEMISFVDTRKIKGKTIYLDDFSIINVEDSIVHILEAEYEDYEIGEEFIIKVNISERANATLNHSAMYWKCLDYSVPCGGTHCNTTNQLGMISVKRKNIGKSADRLIIKLKNIENP